MFPSERGRPVRWSDLAPLVASLLGMFVFGMFVFGMFVLGTVGSPLDASAQDAATPPQANLPSQTPWNQFRGAARDGKVSWLPDRLPTKEDAIWVKTLPSIGIGGIAVANDRVVVGSRDLLDKFDLWQAFDSTTGKLQWQHMEPCQGNLDYGNSPRATPLVHDGRAYVLGAFGNLAAIDMASGIVRWKANLRNDYRAAPPDWGFSGSPLAIGNRLIVQPGGSDASLVAIDLTSHKVIWKTPGPAAAYVSPMPHAWSPTKTQIVGLDGEGIVGWDSEDGSVRWRRTPKHEGDFGVPSPVATEQGLLVTSENNGTRWYPWTNDGIPSEQPAAINEDLHHDSQTPVIVGNRVIGSTVGLMALDLDQGLKSIWLSEHQRLDQYVSLIASPTRVLALTADAHLMLFDIADGRLLDETPLGGKSDRALAAPALVGKMLFVRIGSKLYSLPLDKGL
jgi:outer membrane protein assembly factor BamB